MINENYYVKIQGKANIPVPLPIGHNYRLTADCSVTGENRSDNNDGTYDVTFKVEPITVEIGTSNGETIKARDPRKNSQKIRNYLFKHYHDEGVIEDFDRLYDAFTYEVMSMTPVLMREAIKRLNK